MHTRSAVGCNRQSPPRFADVRQWASVELNADCSRRMLYVPKGFAHGYLTLTDCVEAYYHVSTPYNPEFADGVAWDNPAFGIAWPFTPTVISDKIGAGPRLPRNRHAVGQPDRRRSFCNRTLHVPAT